MNKKTLITHEDIANIGYYFLDPDQEKEFLKSINRELIGIMSEQEAFMIKQRTLEYLKKKRLDVLSKSAENTADE